MLERVQDLVFQQASTAERGEKILFHLGKTAAGNGIARDQNEFHRLRKFMLMQPETFAEQPPGAAAGRRIADFFARDHPQFGRKTSGQFAPVGDETAQRQPLPPLPEAHEITVLRKTRLATQTQFEVWRPGSGIWGRRGHGARKIKPA